MQETPEGRSWVIGINQSLKIIRSGRAKRVILANDAEGTFKNRVKQEIAQAGGVEIDLNFTGQQLAEKAGIDVPAAIITEY